MMECMSTQDAPSAQSPRSRIGPHGEIYANKGTRHQTFYEQGIVQSNDWSAKGPTVIVALLRQMADEIEQYGHKGFVRNAQLFPGLPYRPPEPITTPLCHLRMWSSIEEPPRHPDRFGEELEYTSYRVQVGAVLGFE